MNIEYEYIVIIQRNVFFFQTRGGRDVHNRRWNKAQPTDRNSQPDTKTKDNNRSPKGFHPPPQCRGERFFAPTTYTTVLGKIEKPKSVLKKI
jgi:hypothetical protein